MDVNLSLDDIIKKKKSKSVRRNGKRDGKKHSQTRKKTKKPSIRKVKSNPTTFKRNSRGVPGVRITDARLKLSKVPDARLKILRGKNQAQLAPKNRRPLVAGKGALIDARLKIDAHKQMKQKKVDDQRRPFGITTIGGDGIIERRINANIVDNEIRVEYEDDDMNLEHETLTKENWSGQSLLVRRTIQNNTGRKNGASMHDENRSRSSWSSLYDEPRSFKEVTRTIANSNYEKAPVNMSITRRSYSRRSPVPQSDSFSHSRKMRSSRLSPPTHSSSISRDPPYHLIVISNLHENVTGEDIKELFEDVGDLVHAKMIREGVAEVAYRSHRDAMKAVEIYHNRQLDGLPMKCVLVSTHHDSSSRDRGIPPTNTPSVEPDTHLIKKALFSSSH